VVYDSRDQLLLELKKAGNVLKCADLSQLNLEGETGLASARLSESILIGTRMTGALMIRSNLALSRFDGADLSDSEWMHANLRKTVFTNNTDLSRANFANSILTNSRIESAILVGTIFSMAQMTGVIFGEIVLDRTSFYGTDLRSADLSKLVIPEDSEVIFTNAIMNFKTRLPDGVLERFKDEIKWE
jgi:uncharacterized protein YjbI with pentapeptide repeats